MKSSHLNTLLKGKISKASNSAIVTMKIIKNDKFIIAMQLFLVS